MGFSRKDLLVDIPRMFSSAALNPVIALQQSKESPKGADPPSQAESRNNIATVRSICDRVGDVPSRRVYDPEIVAPSEAV